MKQYQAILLDLDNTLYSYQETHDAALLSLYQACFTHCGIKQENAEQAFTIARKATNTRLDGTAASHNRLLYVQNMCEQLGLNPTRYSLLLYNAYWDSFLDKMQLFPNAHQFLELWNKLGKKICLVTDLTAHIQHRKIAKLGLEDMIHAIVTSEEAGFEKPHPRMFKTALSKLGLNESQVIMIGDHWDKDILGARALGIEAFYFSPSETNKHQEASVNFSRLIEMLS